MSTVLVTGGAGYIGSHTCVALIEAGFRPVLYDNLRNSRRSVVDRIGDVSGYRPELIEGDVRDESLLTDSLARVKPIAVIHFAGLKSVAESVREPLDYYSTNVGGTVALARAMAGSGVRRVIFSSSCTIYGNAPTCPVDENTPVAPTCPYARSKALCEQILADLGYAEPDYSLVSLRYFNPVGAHESGTMGEDPRGIPDNLVPFITQVAVGRLQRLSIFGTDYPTRDGTGIRDYIHVMDLAEAHVAALQFSENSTGFVPINIGTGTGASVLEVVREFEHAIGRAIPHQSTDRRVGDVAEMYADSTRALRLLGWSARRSLREMCVDAWRWQQQNPLGYGD